MAAYASDHSQVPLAAGSKHSQICFFYCVHIPPPLRIAGNPWEVT